MNSKINDNNYRCELPSICIMNVHVSISNHCQNTTRSPPFIIIRYTHILILNYVITDHSEEVGVRFLTQSLFQTSLHGNRSTNRWHVKKHFLRWYKVTELWEVQIPGHVNVIPSQYTPILWFHRHTMLSCTPCRKSRNITRTLVTVTSIHNNSHIGLNSVYSCFLSCHLLSEGRARKPNTC
jgi:hypothetical protein